MADESDKMDKEVRVEEATDGQGQETDIVRTESVRAEERLRERAESLDGDSNTASEASSEKLANLLATRSVLRRKNVYLLKKLFAYCKKKKIGGVLSSDETGPGHGDSPDKYHENLELYYRLKTGVEAEEGRVRTEMGELDRNLSEREAEAADVIDDLSKLQTSVGKSFFHPRTGRQLTNKTIERMISEQNSKMKDLTEARLKYIKMKNLVAKKRRQLADMEEVDSGLCLQDFRQLQMDRQTLDSKIEDKNNELAKAELKMRLGEERKRRLEAKKTRTERALSKAWLIFSQTERRLCEESEQLERLKLEKAKLKQSEAPRLKHEALSAYPILVKDMEESLMLMDVRQNRLEGLEASHLEISRGIRHTQRRIQILRQRQKGQQGHEGLELNADQSRPLHELTTLTAKIPVAGDEELRNNLV